jgi:alpha-tubulin suppressor-like RCC1 family protein
MPTVTNYANTCINDSSIGTISWSNPSNAGGGNQSTNYANLNFGIYPNNMADSSCKLLVAGSITGNDKAIGTSLNTSGNATTLSYSATPSAWGVSSISPSTINLSNFGVAWGIKDQSPLVNSNYLTASNFGFNIPSNATINNISIAVTYASINGDGGGLSFVAGTKIKTLSGFKNIENIQINDIVISYDEFSDTFVEDRVTALKQNKSSQTLLLNQSVETTSNHPFYTKRGWVEAGNLELFDDLLTDDGFVQLTSIIALSDTKTVYNFEVEKNHNYIANSYVVHNPAISRGGYDYAVVYNFAITVDYTVNTTGSCTTQPFISSTTIVADFWRLSNLLITPASIVGGGNSSNGSPQSFTLTPVLNVGLTTSVSITYSPASYISGTSLIVFPLSSDLNQGASQAGFYTGFSTTLPTPVTFTAIGPSNCSLTISNIYLNPFLFSNNTLTPVWPGAISTISTSFQYAGLGATYLNTLILNAYVPTGSAQTAVISTLDSNLYISVGGGATGLAKNGIVTFYGPQNVGIISFYYPAITRNTSVSTSVSISLLNSTGVTTTNFTWSGLTSYSMIFDPIFPNRPGNVYYGGSTYYPVPLQFNWNILQYKTSSGLGSTSFTMPIGVATYYKFSSALNTSFSQDQRLIYSLSSINFDTLDNQTYYVDYYSKQGYPKAMGFDLYGELSQRFSNFIQPPGYAIGQGVGTYSKVYMGLPNVVKIVSGSNHNLALTTSGIVYAIGNNTYGQLNLNTIGYSTNLFTRIGLTTFTDVLLNTIFTDIYAQNNSSYIIASNRNLYAFGQNNYNQLGYASNGVAYTSVPTFVSNNVSLLSVYNNRGFLAKYDNNYSFTQSYFEFGAFPASDGSNNNGVWTGLIQKTNIGIVSYKGVAYTLSSTQVQYVDVGSNHTLAACTWSSSSPSLGFTSGIIAWGYNNNYQLGTSFSTNYISTPQILTKYDNSGNVVPLDFTPYIIAGNQWSLGVVSNNGINSTYFYGPGSATYNGGWISYTGVNTAIGVGQSFFNDPIYKIAKSRDHIIWLTGLGSVYVSGGAARLYLKNVSNTSFIYQSSLIYIDGAPNNIPETQAFAYYPQAGTYSLNYFGQSVTGLQTSNSGFKKITSSISTTKVAAGIDIIMILFNNNEIHTWVYSSNSLVQLNNNFISYVPTNNIIVDIGVGKSYTSFSGSTYLIPSFIASYSKNGTAYTNTITTFLHAFNLDKTYNAFSLLPTLNTTNEASIYSLAAGLTEAKLEKVNIGSIIYDWVSSNYNIVAGYSDGLISVFSDANVGFGTLITSNDQTQRLVAQFAPIQNSLITTMKVVYSKTLNSNLLFVGLGSSLYVYAPKTLSEYNEGNWHLLANATYSSSFGNVVSIMNSNFTVAGATTIEFVPIIFSNGYLYLVPITNNTTLQSLYYSSINLTTPFSSFVTNNPSSGSSDGNFVQFIAVAQNVQEWYFPFENFETGFNYWNLNASSPFLFNYNTSYPTQLMTTNGLATGPGISNINHVSTSDWFTILIDTSNPNNI